MKPRLHPFRFVAAAVALAAIALGASGCGSSINDAATVGDTHIPRRELQNDLKDLLSNPQFANSLKSQGGIVGRDGKAVDARFTAQYLTELIQQAAIDNIFNAHHLTIDAATRNAAAQSLGDTSKFPKGFVNTLIERTARQEVVAEKVKPTVDDARAFYEENKAALFPCPSGKMVAHIVVPTLDQANDILTQLQGGADFATLAREHSTDKATAATGGVITSSAASPGCYPPGQPAALNAAVAKATPGVPSGPVQTPAGYEVFVAKPYTPPPFEQIQQRLVTSLAQPSAGQAAFQALLAGQLHGKRVYVDPRYGTWVTSAQQGAHVQPPAAPAVADSRSGTPSTATTPATSPAG